MAPRKKKEDSDTIKNRKGEYLHYVSASPILENFEEVYDLHYHLIKSYDELVDFYKNRFKPNSFFAWDTETTSLDPTQSVSPDCNQ